MAWPSHLTATSSSAFLEVAATLAREEAERELWLRICQDSGHSLMWYPHVMLGPAQTGHPRPPHPLGCTAWLSARLCPCSLSSFRNWDGNVQALDKVQESLPCGLWLVVAGD